MTCKCQKCLFFFLVFIKSIFSWRLVYISGSRIHKYLQHLLELFSFYFSSLNLFLPLLFHLILVQLAFIIFPALFFSQHQFPTFSLLVIFPFPFLVSIRKSAIKRNIYSPKCNHFYCPTPIPACDSFSFFSFSSPSQILFF